jgi:DNA (cytosine-5)-methyltransferase 1
MKVLDLFCGCGGFSYGFEKAGFEIIAGIDIWDKAIESYKKNFKHLALCRDLTKYPPEQFFKENNIKQIDIIIGGAPCQAYSMAGKRDPKDPRNSLFIEYVKYLDYYQPKIFLFENVVGILSSKLLNGSKVIDIILEEFNKNYNCLIMKLCASDFEVPQNRRRIIVFGIHKKLNILPTELKSFLSKDNRISISKILESKENINSNQFLSQRAINGIKNKKERMLNEGKGFGAQFVKYNQPCYTIPARYWKDGYDALVKYNDNEIRRLSILELKRIQSFPDNYILIGSKKDQIIQIGNAVPCNLAFHLALHLKKFIDF